MTNSRLPSFIAAIAARNSPGTRFWAGRASRPWPLRLFWLSVAEPHSALELDRRARALAALPFRLCACLSLPSEGGRPVRPFTVAKGPPPPEPRLSKVGAGVPRQSWHPFLPWHTCVVGRFRGAVLPAVMPRDAASPPLHWLLQSSTPAPAGPGSTPQPSRAPPWQMGGSCG